MLISKKSRRKSTLFDSQFKDGRGVDFPLRQYMRCREEITGGVIHVILLGAFILTLVYFGRTINHLFDVHGADKPAILRWGVLVVIGVFALVIVRRLWRKLMELKATRAEMVRLKSELRGRPD